MSAPALQSSALLAGAAVAAGFGAFALFQALAPGQPLRPLVARHGARAAGALRVSALAGAGVAAVLVWPVMPGGGGALFAAAALLASASVFVLVAAVRPRLAWGVALLAPVLAVALALAARRAP